MFDAGSGDPGGIRRYRAAGCPAEDGNFSTLGRGQKSVVIAPPGDYRETPVNPRIRKHGDAPLTDQLPGELPISEALGGFFRRALFRDLTLSLCPY